MNDLISRDELISDLAYVPPELLIDRNYLYARIMKLHTFDAAPVVHGRWITNKYGETVCSECDNNALQVLTGCLVNRHFEPYKSKFCPNCGAKMDGEA